MTSQEIINQILNEVDSAIRLTDYQNEFEKEELVEYIDPHLLAIEELTKKLAILLQNQTQPNQ